MPCVLNVKYCRIEENYEKVVGTRKEEFMSGLRIQLATRIGTSLQNIQKLNIWPGSIEVNLFYKTNI